MASTATKDRKTTKAATPKKGGRKTSAAKSLEQRQREARVAAGVDPDTGTSKPGTRARPAASAPKGTTATAAAAKKDGRVKDPVDAAIAKHAQDGLKGDGPKAQITGPNIAALRAALKTAKADLSTFGNERTLRAFAANGTNGKALPDDTRRALRAFVKDAKGIDAGTFYGQKLVRMIVALADHAAGKVKVA